MDEGIVQSDSSVLILSEQGAPGKFLKPCEPARDFLTVLEVDVMLEKVSFDLAERLHGFYVVSQRVHRRHVNSSLGCSVDRVRLHIIFSNALRRALAMAGKECNRVAEFSS